MSIETAYHSMRGEIAREFRDKDGKVRGAPSNQNYLEADCRINAMSHTELLMELMRHEDSE